ncbi:hypothetical protein SynBOUM118_01243 [Synechococcus sp. BOUM118]|nr:hypothetical protein SynBOUM118_01243 [Synechococcus sp. BOUM118]
MFRVLRPPTWVPDSGTKVPDMVAVLNSSDPWIGTQRP